MAYYIHDKTRGWCGNSMVWWAKNHMGYTLDLTKAHVFEESELPEYMDNATDLVAYDVEMVNSLAETHITETCKLHGKHWKPREIPG